MKAELIVAASAAAVIAGCQSHPREPLDVAAHIAAYETRTVADVSVAAFAAGLDAAAPGRIVFDAADGLTLEEAEVVALVFNPELREARAMAGVAAAGAANAGRWEDPMVDVSVERMIAGMESPWTVMTGLAFTLPITGVPQREKQLAEGELGVEVAKAAVMEWETRNRLRRAWVEWSAAKERIGVGESRLGELEGVLALTEKIVRAGGMQRVESQMFRIEREMVAAELTRDRGELVSTELMIRAEMGLPPGKGPELLPRVVIASGAQAAVERPHPKLALAELEYELAERAIELEEAKQFPSVGVGAGTGRDRGDALVSWGLTIPLPVLNANREAIAKAVAARTLERVRCERVHEELTMQAAQAAVKLGARRAEREAFEMTVIPLVDAQAADIAKITEIGRVEPLVLLDSVNRRAESKLRVIEARMEESLAAVDLMESTYATPAVEEAVK
ncbi:MAG: TolC family protein [Phycisphaerales bacterium]